MFPAFKYDTPSLLRTTVRLWIIAATCAACVNVAAARDADACNETRTDVTEFFKTLADKTLATPPGADCNASAAEAALDFSQCSDGNKISFTHSVYGDSIAVRQGEAEMSWYADTEGIRRLKGIVTRVSSLNFSEGLIYNITGNAATEISGTDTLTIVHADGSSLQIPIVTTYAVRPGGSVITAEGDTIAETTIHVAGYNFRIADEAGCNSRATYTATRWEAEGRDFPVVEWVRYSGWNGNVESVTLSAEEKPARKTRTADRHVAEYRPGKLKGLVISDLLGKTVRRYNAAEAAGTTDYGLPRGWYIVTEEYDDTSISEKKYFDGQK